MIAHFRASPAILVRRAGGISNRGVSFIKVQGIESWLRLSALRSHWFFSQTSRWRIRRIIGTITLITPIILIIIITID